MEYSDVSSVSAIGTNSSRPSANNSDDVIDQEFKDNFNLVVLNITEAQLLHIDEGRLNMVLKVRIKFDGWEVGDEYLNSTSEVIYSEAFLCNVSVSFLVHGEKNLRRSRLQVIIYDASDADNQVIGVLVLPGAEFLNLVRMQFRRRSSLLSPLASLNMTDASLQDYENENILEQLEWFNLYPYATFSANSYEINRPCSCRLKIGGTMSPLNGKISSNMANLTKVLDYDYEEEQLNSEISKEKESDNNDNNASEWEIEFYAREKPEVSVVDSLVGDTYHFTKHLDAETGKYYYFDHVSGTTTWAKPKGDLALYLSPEQKESIRTLRWNRFVRRKEEFLRRKIAMERMRTYRSETREKEEREALNRVLLAQRLAWKQALLRAASEGGPGGCECNMSWQSHAIDPSLFQFQNDFGLHLRALRLVGLNLTDLPAEIGLYLRSLEVLSLANNKLRELPDTLVSLCNLKDLNLLNNRLEHLPEKIGLMSALIKLEVANNCLLHLPSTFAALTKLDRIVLEHNHLTLLPENLEYLTGCKLLNLNHNRLIRLPRCLSRMPRLQSLSACNNQLTYLPRELVYSTSLRILRLNRNRIAALPDVIGELAELLELSLDYNCLATLPASFYGLKNLAVLRLEGNDPLVAPPTNVIAAGAQAVVAWCRDKWLDNQLWRRKVIISSLQDLLREISTMELVDRSLFEADFSYNGDTWFALQLNYLFDNLMPTLKDMNREKYTFPYETSEILWALHGFEDATGAVILNGEAMFKRCSCRDPSGRRRPCIPPKKGYMCTRQCTLIKTTIVLQSDKQQRLWMAYKANSIEEAARIAEGEAIKYLSTREGKLWITELSFKQAEEMMDEKGAGRIVQWREKKAQRKKKDIIYRFDTKKRKVQKAKERKIASLKRQIRSLQDRLVASNGGFVKEVLEKQIDELTFEMGNLPENSQLLALQQECEAACKAVDDDLLNASSSSDENTDGDADEEASEKERELLDQMEDRALLQEEERRRADEASVVSSTTRKRLVSSLGGLIDDKNSKSVLEKARRERAWMRTKAKARKRLRYAMDAVEIRFRRSLMTLNGDFKETQQAIEYDLRQQYISNCMATARREAERHLYVLGKVRQQWNGLSMEVCFNDWVIWVKTKASRARRDLRHKYRQAMREFEAGLSCVRIAKLNVDLWRKQTDVLSDRPFWVHRVTGVMSWQQPRLEHYLPEEFHTPAPPLPLPPDVSIDTSSDEDFDPKSRRRSPRSQRPDQSRGDARSRSSEDTGRDKANDTARGTSVQESERDHEENEEFSGEQMVKRQSSVTFAVENLASLEYNGTPMGTSRSSVPLGTSRSSARRAAMQSLASSRTSTSDKLSSTGKSKMREFRRAKARKKSGLQSFLEDLHLGRDTTTDFGFHTLGEDLGTISENRTYDDESDSVSVERDPNKLEPEAQPDEGNLEPQLWNPRWELTQEQQGKVVLASPKASMMSPKSPKRTRSPTASFAEANRMSNSVGFVYGPDSLRVGKKGPGGSGLGCFDVPLFEFEPPTDVASTRERGLQEVCNEFVVPALAAIEGYSAEGAVE